ncbi:MAG: glycosyltransferase [Solirubrobacterales bacterium]|nr:glycosyltransferase [Solirubrobacterales bacterium]
MLRVVAESAYPALTPGPRVRVAALAPFLREHDVDLCFHPHVSDAEYRILGAAGSRRAKAAVVARCAGRVARRSRPPDALLMVHRLLSLVPVPGHDPPARVDVYDFDDALFEGSISAANRGFGALKRERERCLAHLRRARLVLAGNSYLASHAARHAQRVEIVPSCIDASALTPRTHSDVEIVTVGWIGSASTTPYLLEILPVLRAINARELRMRLLAVGAARLPAEPWIEQHAWSLAGEAQMLRRFDVGVMPLPDDRWTRGKCGYKLLQYFATGVPAVASPVGVNALLLERGGGRAASTPAQWRDALQELGRDASARRGAARSGRELAESEYSYQRWAPQVAAMLRSL